MQPPTAMIKCSTLALVMQPPTAMTKYADTFDAVVLGNNGSLAPLCELVSMIDQNGRARQVWDAPARSPQAGEVRLLRRARERRPPPLRPCVGGEGPESEAGEAERVVRQPAGHAVAPAT